MGQEKPACTYAPKRLKKTELHIQYYFIKGSKGKKNAKGVRGTKKGVGGCPNDRESENRRGKPVNIGFSGRICVISVEPAHDVFFV